MGVNRCWIASSSLPAIMIGFAELDPHSQFLSQASKKRDGTKSNAKN